MNPGTLCTPPRVLPGSRIPGLIGLKCSVWKDFVPHPLSLISSPGSLVFSLYSLVHSPRGSYIPNTVPGSISKVCGEMLVVVRIETVSFYSLHGIYIKDSSSLRFLAEFFQVLVEIVVPQKWLTTYWTSYSE